MVDTVTRLRARRSGVRFPAEGGDLCRLQFVQTDAEAQPACHLVSTGGKTSGGVKISTHLRLVPRLRMSGAVPLPPPPMCCHMCRWAAVPFLSNYKFSDVAELRT